MKNSRVLIRKLLFAASSGGASAHVKTEHQASLRQAENRGSLRVLRVCVIPVLHQLAAVRANTPVRQRWCRAHLGGGCNKGRASGRKAHGRAAQLGAQGCGQCRYIGQSNEWEGHNTPRDRTATGEAVTVEHRALAQLTGPGRRVLSYSGFGARCPLMRRSDSD